MDLHSFSDIHTHVAGRPDSILSIPVSGVDAIRTSNALLPSALRQHYSLQFHPWHLPHDPTELRKELSLYSSTAHQLCADPQFVALGECGFDALCHTPLPLQREAFRQLLQLSYELHLPLIIHCVRLWDELLAAVKASPLSDSQRLCIIHGFRKGPTLARQLLNAGFSISIGTHHHPEVPSIIPSERLYHETDAQE